MDIFIFAESLTALKNYSGGRQQQICLESHFEKFFKCIERRKVFVLMIDGFGAVLVTFLLGIYEYCSFRQLYLVFDKKKIVLYFSHEKFHFVLVGFSSIFCLKHIWYETRQKISLENISVKLLREIYPVQNLKGAGLNFKANWRKVEILNVLTLKRKSTVSDERQIIREVDTCCLEAPNHGDYHKRVVYLILKTPVMF